MRSDEERRQKVRQAAGEQGATEILWNFLLNNGTILIMGLVVGHIFDAHKPRSDCAWNCIL